MTIEEIANQVVNRKQFVLIKENPDKPGDYLVDPDNDFELCEEHEEDDEEHGMSAIHNKKKTGYVLLDLFTASHIKAVCDALKKPETKDRYLKLPLRRLVEITYKVLEGK